ncbi:YybH family protein [Microvirga alba]|uniref:Nuclear transport factor 2 family protein n=1 Tax=Microvirga alba TaxID=2791025 RepID=A0A931BNI3_9HYPH|nr:nuclear transport factor 2 family protein [Microvirga alba]MBF9233203.1 nuclear transport factor 2 family protein [Microvirga alba]
MPMTRTGALVAGLLFWGVSGPAAGQTMPAEQLMEADRAFNAMGQREGVGKAFIAYAADAPIMLRPPNMPILGKAELVEVFSKVTDSSLTWEPLKAEIAGSQDLGYTFGRYKVHQNGEVKLHGAYVTIWKKQPDGSWKYVLDGGGATPREVQKP